MTREQYAKLKYGSDAEWAHANEWETPITLGDHLDAAADALEALLAEVRRLNSELQSENTQPKPDGKCREDDGCPTENAVLRREWRKLTEQLAITTNDYFWISVAERLPERPMYDWVLVKTEFVPEGGSGVPHVAELRNGVWYCDCCDGPMEETLGVKVVAWFDMQTIKERSTK